MDKSINVKNERQPQQKPPISIVRIAGEILVGTATGVVLALPVAWVIGLLFADADLGRFDNLGFMAMFILAFPPLYGPASAVGVYFIGNTGQQTGSFFWTIGSSFLGGLLVLGAFIMLVMLPGLNEYFGGLMAEEKAVQWILLFILPVTAVLGFNLTRRYKKPAPS